MSDAEFHAGRYRGAVWRPSPNCDDRPSGVTIDLLVIHAISLPPGKFGGQDIDALFCNTLDCTADPFYAELVGLHVSAHFVIERHGGVTQYVSTERRAWHAGVSSFGGRTLCNDYSIGIELEGDDATPFESSQYAALIKLTCALRQAHPRIAISRMVGHADIAPARRTDPGPYFDWVRFRASLVAGR